MEGEVRRIHIIYFLSRKGRIEHPHLVRVHHVLQNGVHLCDVKRWLAALRGKDMPESFAWSYKRRYRTGYVWQDLVDEDLITPISDNEYVLKGSEISSNNITHTNASDIDAEKRVYIQKESIEKEENGVDQNLSSLIEIQQHQKTTIYISPKTSPIFSPNATDVNAEKSVNIQKESIEHEEVGVDQNLSSLEEFQHHQTSPIFSPEASTQTENWINLEEDKLQETNKHGTTKGPSNAVESDTNSSSFISTQFSEKNEKNNKKSISVNSSGRTSQKSKPSCNMMRKIFNCRDVETKESAMDKFNKRKRDREFCNIGNNMA